MRRYAEKTEVGVDASHAEIRSILNRYGCEEFGYVQGSDRAGVAFRFDGVAYRIDIPLPDRNDRRFWVTPSRGLERTPEAAREAWEGECRRLWRVTVLLLKAQLEYAEVTGTPLAQVFMDHRLLPDGRRLADAMTPQLESIAASAEGPRLLPWFGERS